MKMYITPALQREHSRLDYGNASDEYLKQIIAAAQMDVAKALQVDSLEELEKDGDLDADIKQAILMRAGTYFEDRESESPVQMHAQGAYEAIIRKNTRYKG